MKKYRTMVGKFFKKLNTTNRILKDRYYEETERSTIKELGKAPKRTVIINFLITFIDAENYLEIGVRNPNDNFNNIICKNKYSVDPGVEYDTDTINFKLTSNAFFDQLATGKLALPANQRFDVIFIDGLHLANQTELDILNSLRFLTDQGLIVLHDCNPPTEFHQREDYYFRNSPARGYWSGTTWKAFYKYRHKQDLYSLCFDTDWGVGVLSKIKYPLFNNLPSISNPFYEFNELQKSKEESLNLQSFDVWKELMDHQF